MKIDLDVFERLYREGHEAIPRDELVPNLNFVERLLRDANEAAAEIGLSRAERRQAARSVGRLGLAAIAIAARQQATQAIGLTGRALSDPTSKQPEDANHTIRSVLPAALSGLSFPPLLARADEFAQIIATHKAKKAPRGDTRQNPHENGDRP